MKEETRKSVLAAMMEAGFVVFGVVLALLANEWRQSIADRKAAEVALSSVLAEIDENQAALETSLEYHDSRIAMILQALDEERPLSAQDFPQGFIRSATTFRTAWETAGQTGALANIPYDVSLELSRLYAQQGRYEKQSEIAGEIIYQALFDGGTDEIVSRPVSIVTLISSFVYRERSLVEEYRKAQKRLKDRELTRSSVAQER